MKLAVTLCSLFLATPLAVAQSTLNVPAQFATIQGAIVAAVNGDTVDVQPGTYIETIDFLGKAITVRAALGAATTIIDGNQTGVVARFLTAETPASVLDGFTLRNGLGTATGQAGGIDAVASSPTIRNCLVTNCAGALGGAGGMRIQNGAPLVVNTRFVGNTGGGGQTTVCFGPFSSSQGGPGGAGAIVIQAPTAGLLIDRCIFESNVGGTGGTGICGSFLAYGGLGGAGAVSITSTAPVPISRCVFRGNTGGAGGIGNGYPNGIAGNGGPGALGAVFSFAFGSLSLTLVGCVFIANTGGPGAAMTPPGYGGDGAVMTTGVALIGIHLTVTANVAGPNNLGGSGGVRHGGTMFSSANFGNCIFWGNFSNGAPQDLYGSGLASFSTNCDIGVTNANVGPGNISADPQFVNVAAGDIHLGAASPCRNVGILSAGLPPFDIDGDPRIVGPLPDMGADEIDALVGTREDLVLEFRVNGVVPASIPSASIAAGQAGAAVITSPTGTFAAAFVFLVGELYTPPAVPFPPPSLPEVHISTGASILATIPGLGAGGFAIAGVVPPGLSGLAVRLQAMAPLANGVNGIFAASAARDVLFL